MDLVILAGGKGSRIQKYLFNKPKPLAIFGKYSFLDFLIFNVSKFLFKKIYILAGFKGHLIYKKFNNKIINFSKIEVIIEKFPLGTGGALYSLKKKIKNDFFVINGDTIFDINFFDLSKIINKNSFGVIALTKSLKYLKKNKLSNLDILNKNKLIYSKKNKYINGGVYFFKKKILNCISHKEISLENDIIANLINKGKIQAKFFNNFFWDIGTPYFFLRSKKVLKSFFYRPALFLDRDGTINKDIGYTYKIQDLEFMPNILRVIKLYSRKKYYLFVITNQSGIAKKKFTLQSFFKFQKYLFKKFLDKRIYINDFQYCPHHPDALIKKYKKKCKCRKPNDLMIKNIINKWPIIKKKSLFIGNEYHDYLTAKKSNIKFIYYYSLINN
jgi:D-glycero-D-manno-heptose 1,7-bisphosphate phosphatase